MPQVQLPDAVFEVARRRATEAGFGSVDECVADVLLGDLPDAEFDTDTFFTPERLAAIDQGIADVRGGRVFTSEQLDVVLAKRRASWVEANRR